MTDVKYKLSVDKDNLIVIVDDKKYICEKCVYPKSKKTKRLVHAIKKKGNLTMKVVVLPNDTNAVHLVITHPLYEDEIYHMVKEGFVQNDNENKVNDTTVNSMIVNDGGVEENIPLCFVYVLELEQDKYYVGKSVKPINRTGEHLASVLLNDATLSGSGWTRMYNPIKILEVRTSYDEFDEDKVTLHYMKEKGIDNVRGGSFCELNLLRENVATLEKMLAGADDKCYYCGSSDHYIKDCPQKNIKRVTKKTKTKKLKFKDIPKSRIAKYYGATKLLQNSNIDTSEVKNNDCKKDLKCKFCGKVFDTYSKQTYHENMACDKNIRVELGKMAEANVDAILEKNKHLLENRKSGKKSGRKTGKK